MQSDRESLKHAEQFVRSVLAKAFNQKLDRETLRAVAEKVLRAAKPTTHAEAPTSKKAA